MRKITPKKQRKNARDIFKLLNTQGSDLRAPNWEDTVLTALLAAPGTHKVKVVYGMGLGTGMIGQILTITKKSLCYMEREVSLLSLTIHCSYMQQ